MASQSKNCSEKIFSFHTLDKTDHTVIAMIESVGDICLLSTVEIKQSHCV